MAARRKKTAEEPCPEHYPNGIPDGVDGVGCEHGSWSRDGAKPADPPKDPENPPKDPDPNDPPKDPENPDGGKGDGE